MRKSILTTVAQRYPDLDPDLALLALYRKNRDIYTVAKVLERSPSGIYRAIEKAQHRLNYTV